MPKRTFDALFGAHYLRVLRYAERRIADQQVAEDVAADTFELAWQRISAEGAEIDLPWLYQTAAFKLRDQYRRNSRRREAVSALERFAEEAPDALNTLDRLALVEALRSLSDRDREVLMLTYWDGLSASEVGAVVGTTTGAVWATLSRARTKLKAQLDADTRAGGRHVTPGR